MAARAAPGRRPLVNPGSIRQFRQQWSGAAGPSGRRRTEGFTGWQSSPKEEVPVSSSCFKQGLLIAENAG